MFSHTPIATTTRRRTRLVIGASVCLGIAIATVSIAPASPAYADTVAYLVNVTVRPGYNFPNADAAISYGNEICDKVEAARGYADLKSDVIADFSNADDYQAAYLINQAVGELCPTEIWQLRQLAATHYGRT
ncbi:DUF732 domain-containing protein [Mycolicibacterium phocaicum]|uniref:DUF732 domain-containing protein n=1 Tax=Mycolicibacterium phocaicum TaxID=319706 RepID=A0A7I7ZWM9_9MYCO|nr:DUF732 domain-containing protein [Mycolicibacterium phocaicum]TLH58321.1 DUF732 domain-containing protein [Mycolicibacterium phocaicum]BBZ58152.1 membrane protein [Mycolicibacterium phocaicum]